MSRFFRTVGLMMGAQLRAVMEASVRAYRRFILRYREGPSGRWPAAL